MSKNETYTGDEVKNLYFDVPVQVMFKQYWDGDKKFAGIAFCGEVIAADDGTPVSMEDISYLHTMNWVDFTEAIEDIEEEEENEPIR